MSGKNMGKWRYWSEAQSLDGEPIILELVKPESVLSVRVKGQRGHSTTGPYLAVTAASSSVARPASTTRKANSNRKEPTGPPNPYRYVFGSNAQKVRRGFVPPDHHLGRDRTRLDKDKQKFFDIWDGFDASDPMSVDTLVQFLEGFFDGLSVEDSNKALIGFLGYLIDQPIFPELNKPELIERSHQHVVISIGHCLHPETAGLTEQELESTSPSDFDKAQACIVNALEDNVAFWFMDVRPHRCIHYPTVPGSLCGHCCDLAEHECVNGFLALSAIARYCKKLGYCGIAVLNSGGKKTDGFFNLVQQVESTYGGSGARSLREIRRICTGCAGRAQS
jgi:hypothetical protein